MKKSYLNKGFTLIELLVVIAIIGILSSVVLASLSTARTKSKEAAVKSGMAQLRTAMEIYYNGTGAGTYGAIASCSTGGFSDTNVLAVTANVRANAAATPAEVCSGDQASGNDGAWSYSVSLPTSGSWCVDSAGTASATTDSNTDGDCGA